MNKPFFFLLLAFCLFTIFTYAAESPGEEAPEPEHPDPEHPDPKEPNGASSRSAPLIYAVGLLCSLVWFHLSEILG